MVQDKQTRVSAFAVQKAHQGKHKLDEEQSSELARKVQKLHSDEKFNKTASKIASNYERNLISGEKKKAKKKKDKKLARKQAQLTEKSGGGADQPVKEKPLSWHNAPKSDKRVKVKLANEDNAVEQHKSNGKQQPAKSEKNTERNKSKREKKRRAKAARQSKESHGDDDVPDLVSSNQSSWEKTTPEQQAQKTKIGRKKDAGKTAENTLTQTKKNAKSNSHNGTDAMEPHKKSNERTMPKDIEMYYDEEEGSEGSSIDPAEHENPDKVAQELFTKLLFPHKPHTFFKKTWLKKPLHISRGDKSYYEDDAWFSTDELDRILTEERVRFGVNIDLTTFKDGKRETHNPAGRAYPSIVWDHYQQGCSVRLLNPQTYTDEVWYLLSTLQELFGCMVGANVYLTPPGTQGFAPHYDDIEGFVLQLEGCKRWRVYGPRSDADISPLTSSPNLTEEELGPPVIDCTLQPGDLLYFPRGAIHQAMTQDDQHSLHITVSTHQKNSWSDLFKLMVPAALQNMTENDPEFRGSLPNDYLNYTGIAFQDQEGAPREAFMNKIQKFMDKMISFAPVDAACDMMAKKFIHDSLPPYLDPTERCFSIAEQGEKWVQGKVRDIVEVEPDTRVRLIRKHSLRILNEPLSESERESAKSNSQGDSNQDPAAGDAVADAAGEAADDVNSIRVYYNTDNDRLYHGNDLQYFEVDGDLAPGIEFLQLSYPEFVAVEDIPIEGVENKLEVAMQLYDRGLLLTESPLNSLVEESDNDSAEFSSDGPSDGEDLVTEEDEDDEEEDDEFDGEGDEDEGEEGSEGSEGDWFDDEAEEVEEGEESESGDNSDIDL